MSNNDFIINELKRRLNKEKIKNQNLIDENNNLKNNINNLNNTIINLNNQINNYVNQIQLLQNQINNYNYNLNNNLNNNQIINNNYINSLKPGEKILSINFVSMGFQDIMNYSLPCKNTDLFVKLEEKLNNDYQKLKDKETYFIVNTRRIKRFKTLDENQIKGGDVINVFLYDGQN